MLNDEEFSRLAEKYMDSVFNTAFSWLKNRADADDVTQNVLLQLLKTNKEFESDSHVKNWLIRVTVNQCKNIFRAPWHRHEALEDYEQTLSFEMPESSDLFRTVMKMDGKYSTTLMLYYYEGYSVKEISKLMETPEKTVITRLSRGRDKLKNILTEADNYDRAGTV